MEWLQSLGPAGLIKVGLGIGIAAMLFLGDGAPIPVEKWLANGLRGLFSRVAPTGPKPEDDCLAALQCLMGHAIRAGDQALITKLIEVVEPVHRLHNSQQS